VVDDVGAAMGLQKLVDGIERAGIYAIEIEAPARRRKGIDHPS
jgi:hypothetical protein